MTNRQAVAHIFGWPEGRPPVSSIVRALACLSLLLKLSLNNTSANLRSTMFDQMLLSIGLIIASLLVGVLVGIAKKTFSDGEKKLISRGMTGMVFVLIFLMGMKTGLNKSVMDGLAVFGFNALVISVAAIAGSIVFAVLFDKLVLRSGSK